MYSCSSLKPQQKSIMIQRIKKLNLHLNAIIFMAQQYIYPRCQRGADHNGQLLNLVCLERNCSHQSIICDICYAQAHQGHRIKPLKALLNNAKKYFKNKELPNITQLKDSLMKQQKGLTLLLNQFEHALHRRMQDIYNSAKNVYPMLAQQLQKQSGYQIKQHIETLELLRQQQLPYDAFNSFMQTLLEQLPSENPTLKTQSNEVTVAQLQQNLGNFSFNLQKQFTDQCKKVQVELIKINSFFQEIRSRQQIIPPSPNYTFDPNLKHTQILITSPKIVRSAGNDSYRFALLSPALDASIASYKGQFFIRKKLSEWVGVGVCSRNRVKRSNFNFDYISPDHGAYMVSSNGGGWSEIDSTINGTFWGFKFQQKDHVVVHYNPSERRIIFTNLRTQQQRSLAYEVSADDQLHFCILFYFDRDQIEFLGQYKP